MQTSKIKTKTLAISLALLFFSVGILQAQVSSRNASLQQNMVSKTAATGYKIDVNIPTPIMNKLITAWGARQQSDIAGDMRVEVWSVIYQPAPNDPNTMQILLQQKQNASVSIQPSTDGVGYMLTGAPQGSNNIVLLYCAVPQSVSDLKIRGVVNPGGTGFVKKNYVSNVKTRLGNPNITFGIYSLPSPGSIGPLSFSLQSPSAMAGQMQTMDLFGDIVGDIEAVGNAIVNAAGQILNAAGQVVGTVANWVVQMGGNYAQIFGQLVTYVLPLPSAALIQFLASNASDIAAIIQAAPQAIIDGISTGLKDLGNGIVAVVIDGMNFILYGNLPHIRSMTQQEYDWANAYIYNGSLPALSKLKISNMMTVDHRACTIPMPDGTIQLNLGDGMANPIGFAKASYGYDGMLFLHELGHAWQIGKYGAFNAAVQGLVNGFLGVTGKDVYTYYPDCNDSWTNYNLEQQATIIDAGFAEVYGGYSFAPPNAGSCKDEANFIIQNVRAGMPMSKAVIDGIFGNYYTDQNIINITGGPNGILAYSNGNRNDGDGYFMAGHKPNTFFYYSNRAGKGTLNYGPIRDKYANAAGAEHGPLGWPVGNIGALTNGGYFQPFQHGNIYWTPTYGSYVVESSVLEAWAKYSYEKGPLGYPISDFVSGNTGGNGSGFVNEGLAGSGYQKFQGGTIRLTGGVNSQAEVALNNSMINKTAHNVVPTAKPGINGVSQGAPAGVNNSLHPGAAQSLNPQPLPPKIN